MAQRELDLVMSRNPNIENGAKLYETCAACHGAKGEGASDGSIPALAGQSFMVIAKQVVDFRAGVRADARMEHFSDRRHLSFSQPIADVAFYIAKLPAPRPGTPPAGASLSRGALEYARSCERCHGVSGEGKEDTLSPRLASQHYEYLVRQLNDVAENRRPAMAEVHASLVRRGSPEELEAIAAFLSSLPQ